MLEYLHIRNLALIENMELEFAAGMNALTGETGAGKSFVLKALGFLLGDRLTAEMVRPGADRAQVEALFVLEGNEITLRRELSTQSGRSRLFVNNTLTAQDELRALRERLVTFTSQHSQQQLLQPAFQARLIENMLPEPQLLRERDDLLAQLREIATSHRALLDKQSALAERRDLLEMQQQQIDRVAPREGEEEALEALRANARACAHLRENYENALGLLHGENGLLDLLGHFERLLRKMSGDDAGLAVDAEAVSEARTRLAHLGDKFRRPQQQGASTDIDSIESRLFALAQLKRTLRRGLAEILCLRQEIADNLSFLDACALDISRLSREEKALAKKLADVVTRIKPLRHNIANMFGRNIEAELRDLGFSEQIRVIPDFLCHELWPGVTEEHTRLLWAPNPGQPPQPLDRIASGGELSRFLLALVGMQRENKDATCIFDEVDAGVGGLALNKLADKLNSLSKKRQMLLITHWPQLAAHATKHFHISKVVRDDATFTLCTPLDDNQRLEELARMAGGGARGEALAQSLKG
ncbi:MAG: DNA repair/recombination protein RecN [Candidatus Desulfovibrio kirbyi]|uniref:DNA repair protein RecN n=1 Tax=Candidatus Desulfovibrio kirbyi TaxID=2696086 RepID=A0A6L2R6E2_9BACT|nr:MAG: DNA repair/recombination protein RecN [Candidatus Desulfovibrio kirbyi]